MLLPTVAVVGRVNVGKSAFFNRMIGRRDAIVDSQPGVTRDRHIGVATWGERDFFVIDTGGVAPGSEDPLQEAIEHQVLLAIDESDVLILLVDVTAGVHPFDRSAADMARRSGLPVLLAVNKVDNSERERLVGEFYELGMGDPWPVSAMHGRGMGDLLDAVVEVLPPSGEPQPEQMLLAVVGRPNVGKSSLVNLLCRQERSLVMPEAGTTRDSTDMLIRWEGHSIRIVDTAGLRRKSRKMADVEYYSTVRAWRSMSVSDVVHVMLDGSEYPTQQDLRIAGKAWEIGKGVVFGVNKIDLGLDRELWREAIEQRFSAARWIPVLFHSALTGEGVDEVLPTAWRVGERRAVSIPTSVLNRVLQEAVERNQPPSPRGKQVKFFYATQVGTRPPKILVFVNRPSDAYENYRRYLRNCFMEALDLSGVPLKMLYRKRKH